MHTHPQLCRDVCSRSPPCSLHSRMSCCHSPATSGHTATTSPFSTVLLPPSNWLASRLPANSSCLRHPFTSLSSGPGFLRKNNPETTSPMAHALVFTSEHCPQGKLKQASPAGGCNSERKAEEGHRASLQMGASGRVRYPPSLQDRVVRVLSGPPLSAAQRFPREQ